MPKLLSRHFRIIGISMLALAMTVAMVAFGILGVSAARPASAADLLVNRSNAPAAKTYTFTMVPAAGIAACLPNASAKITITKTSLNDKMNISVSGLAPSTGYDFFVIELPTKPFGVSWYQTDVQTNQYGSGSANVEGIFNVETFSISLGDNQNPSVVFPATHQYHLGLWFNNPKVPFNLGCEPGQPTPVVTPFNGEQDAGIQVLNTSNYNPGPLSQVPA